jgi:hypothetical protein
LDLLSVLRDNVEQMAAKTSEVPKVRLGSQGLEVSAQGLGCMGTVYYPELEGDMGKLIQYAVDEGITFLDTSDVYGPYTNEILVGKVCVEVVGTGSLTLQTYTLFISVSKEVWSCCLLHLFQNKSYVVENPWASGLIWSHF